MNYDPAHFSTFDVTVPAGLEPLLSQNFVNIEFMGVVDLESFVKTSSENIIYTSQNEFQCCDCAGEAMREILLCDLSGRPVMQFVRVNDSCCRGSAWSSQTLIVQAPPGTEIGRIVMTPGFLSSSFKIYDNESNCLASFERNMLKLLSLSYDFTTPLSGGMLLQLAELDRKVGCGSVQMNLTYHNVSDYRLKVCMLASAYLITILHKERRQS